MQRKSRIAEQPSERWGNPPCFPLYKMPVIFISKIRENGNSKVITVPKKWAKAKKEIGAILFDLKKKDERKLYHETQEDIIDKSD